MANRKNSKRRPKGMTSTSDLFIFAGETSGDIHGGEILEKIRKKDPKLSICGVSGSEMKKHKMVSLLTIDHFQVMGFIDIIFSLPRLIKNYFFLKKRILQINPKACLFIDYPEFSFILQSALRKGGYKGKIIHYICPSVWAWRKNRIRTMQKNLDLLLCIYPFEKRFLQNHLPSKYVGNPLISKLNQHEYEEKWHLSGIPLIGIFPGSRSHEIQRNLPLQLQAAREIQKKHPNFFFVISTINNKNKKIIYEIAERFKSDFQEKLMFMPSSKNYDLMNNLELAIATSGTINLELAFHKVPTIVTYKVKPLDFFIARNILKINLPFYCIVNIIAKKTIFPELYGLTFTKENLVYYLNKILLEKSFKEKIIDGCEEVKKIFCQYNEQTDPAEAILSSIND